ncbi:helicase/secretion neighborhood TadE-like protein [Amycolatopsis xylanica]|uniref:Helicase/secretion neighborhood TadE-like protein n=1 Tax=Amycolatopsis xylanica TaxID=589385 RepID=A0A1H2Z900_9PSEU|nr:helicase/secretion neighborhood TadE-like protein [Amycolatopsis xylanica]
MLAAVAVLLVLVIGMTVCWIGVASICRRRAETAADLSALAAAGGPSCERARRVTEAMGIGLSGCRFVSGDALVEVRLELAGVLGPWGSVAARARAGPVDRPP